MKESDRMTRQGRFVHVILICALFLLFPTLARAEAPASPDAQSRFHIVRRGETLASIAQRYGVSVSTLAAANGLRNPNFVYVGQRLLIPGRGSTPAPSGSKHVVRRGETLASIARHYGVSVQALAIANGLRNPNFVYVGQRLVIPGRGSSSAPAPAPTSSYQIHVVSRGQTLSGIARRYGVSIAALMQANRLRSPNFIYIGQRLIIPGGSKPASVSPSSPAAPTTGKWIEVNVRTQTLTAWEGNRRVLHTSVSTGLPRTPTVLGTFRIYLKLRSQRMVGPGYNLPGVPWVMYFYAGYALHGTYWHNNFGHPMSHGCVNMRTSDAKWLYNWAPMGTIVKVHA